MGNVMYKDKNESSFLIGHGARDNRGTKSVICQEEEERGKGRGRKKHEGRGGKGQKKGASMVNRSPLGMKKNDVKRTLYLKFRQQVQTRHFKNKESTNMITPREYITFSD